jgi:hypothetical protein
VISNLTLTVSNCTGAFNLCESLTCSPSQTLTTRAIDGGVYVNRILANGSLVPDYESVSWREIEDQIANNVVDLVAKIKI